MSTTDLYADLIRRAEACDAAAEEHAINGDTSDARADDGRSSAYRHAAELLRGAVAAAVEEERATCAMIAGREGVAWAEAARIDGVDYWAPRRASSDIADAIRARGESPRGDAASDGREGAE
jgi:hypothetical protein